MKKLLEVIDLWHDGWVTFGAAVKYRMEGLSTYFFAEINEGWYKMYIFPHLQPNHFKRKKT